MASLNVVSPGWNSNFNFPREMVVVVVVVVVDLAISKNFSNLSGFAAGRFQFFYKIHPDFLQGSPTITQGPPVLPLQPIRKIDFYFIVLFTTFYYCTNSVNSAVTRNDAFEIAEM